MYPHITKNRQQFRHFQFYWSVLEICWVWTCYWPVFLESSYHIRKLCEVEGKVAHNCFCTTCTLCWLLGRDLTPHLSNATLRAYTVRSMRNLLFIFSHSGLQGEYYTFASIMRSHLEAKLFVLPHLACSPSTTSSILCIHSSTLVFAFKSS